MCLCIKSKDAIRIHATNKFMKRGALSEMEKEILWGDGCFSLNFVLKHPNLFNEMDCTSCSEEQLLQELKNVS